VTTRARFGYSAIVVTVGRPMLDDNKKALVLKLTLKGIIHPIVAAVQKSYIKSDFSILIRIILIDGSGVYGLVDANNDIWLLSPFEWLEKVGIEHIANEYGIETVEAID
jgi:hypothetical protein